MRILTFTLMLLATVSVSCQDSKGGEGDNLNAAEIDNKRLPETSIEFKEYTYDFGKVKDGEKVQHTFEFTNVGKHPLKLQSVTASCGCTTPSWSKDMVPGGEIGKVEVVFNSKNKVGPVNKVVTVMTANTNPNKILLNIVGEVTE